MWRCADRNFHLVPLKFNVYFWFLRGEGRRLPRGDRVNRIRWSVRAGLHWMPNSRLSGDLIFGVCSAEQRKKLLPMSAQGNVL